MAFFILFMLVHTIYFFQSFHAPSFPLINASKIVVTTSIDKTIWFNDRCHGLFNVFALINHLIGKHIFFFIQQIISEIWFLTTEIFVQLGLSISGFSRRSARIKKLIWQKFMEAPKTFGWTSFQTLLAILVGFIRQWGLPGGN